MGEMRYRGGFALACVVLVLGAAAAVPARAQTPRLGRELRAQIAALQNEKASRSAVQRKVCARLLHAARMRRGLAIAPGVPSLRTGVDVAPDGTTLVDLQLDLSPGVLARIEALGGEVLSAHPRHRAARTRVPIALLETLAALPAVQSIRPADLAITHKIDTSEGDVAHGADLLRASLGVDASGIAVGVLSDGVDSLASLQASGDLPAVTVLPGQGGSGTEGTAMLEIVHDLAPGADLLFATAFGGQASFADNILALRDAGADVIVDDVAYFAEAVFQDDGIAAAADEVAADGRLYFSSAGNSGNLNDATAGVWEGDYAFSGVTLNGSELHDFGGAQFANQVSLDTPFVFNLHWSDAQGASASDYDLYLADPTLSFLVASSTDFQNGNDDPYEQIDSRFFDDTNHYLLVVRFSGSERYLHLNSNRGRLAIATVGQTAGHSAARGALSVAAVDVADAGGPGGRFDGTEAVETFSSDGPRRVFYQADGTPITPGDFSSSGGELRQKPDLTAADGVSTATPGFGRFLGTSAAAPHAAAIAALLLELAAGHALGADAVREALLDTALDIEAPGIDRDSGTGIVDAPAAAAALAPSTPVPALGPPALALLALLLIGAGAHPANRRFQSSAAPSIRSTRAPPSQEPIATARSSAERSQLERSKGHSGSAATKSR